MKGETSLKNHFLVAMPGMLDPNFEHTVALVCEHNQDGAMGVVINRPLDINVSEILKHLEIPPSDTFKDRPALAGGPVHEHIGFVLHQGDTPFESSLPIGEHLYLTSSKDALAALAKGETQDYANLILGYAGWTSGQLERELEENAWLVLPATPEIIFEVPVHKRWEMAIRSLGIDPAHLSPDIGRA